MIDFHTREIQKKIFQNKVDRGFNISSVEKEVCLINGELAEFYRAYMKHSPMVEVELADVAIYLFGLVEIMDVDLGHEILQKMEIN